MLENSGNAVRQNKLWFEKLISMKKIVIIFLVFFFDRVTKFYLINLQAAEILQQPDERPMRLKTTKPRQLSLS